MDFVNTHPGAAVIRGGGWSNTVFGPAGPDKIILDEVVRDLPVALSSEDGHSTWVNSRTLRLAGVTKATQNPPGGIIERDPKTGEPNGTLRESAADLVSKVIPDYTVEELARGEGIAEADDLKLHDQRGLCQFPGKHHGHDRAGQERRPCRPRQEPL